MTPAIITLALRVRQLAPGDPTQPISRVLVTGALVALISNPVIGALSDRTHSRFGRRRPWLVGGAIGGCLALAVIGIAPSVNVILLGWCLAQLAYNATLSALVALLPDRIPSYQRGTVVGILGVCMPVGQIAGTYLVHLLSANMLLALLVPGLIGLAGVLLLAMVLHEGPRSRAAAQPDPDGEPTDPAAVTSGVHLAGDSAVRGRRDFYWTWLSRVLFTTGSSFLQAYQPFFLLDALKLDPADVPRLIFQSTLMSCAMVVIWSLVSGRLSDRTGRRKPFVIGGAAVQSVGLCVIAFSDSYAMLLSGVALLGIGSGIYNGVDLALVTDVLPDRDQHAAKDLGLINIANTLPQVIAPLAAPALLAYSHGDYALVFAAAAAISFVGSATLLPLRSVR